jgi:hypothetical protein
MRDHLIMRQCNSVEHVSLALGISAFFRRNEPIRVPLPAVFPKRFNEDLSCPLIVHLTPQLCFRGWRKLLQADRGPASNTLIATSASGH